MGIPPQSKDDSQIILFLSIVIPLIICIASLMAFAFRRKKNKPTIHIVVSPQWVHENPLKTVERLDV